ncbi:high-affinity choline transporter 1-like [Corythoichthys intestinalis]|uniref:high-affinity choline transporter 1-like n=1 Tax=Corythoichthys intestinalis TaxID=161448 RepID=UPI0025A4FEEE|nr:high-affinity choline transporter 1-like [Corythoichthys intestinalis]XP_061793072.1 high-affinity choline transporter 1-like [Nerophis lumbriciformis]
MSVNIPGVALIVVFYLLVLGTGIWASRKTKKMRKNWQANQMDITLLGNRGIHLIVGVFTMTATFTGGGFIVGLSEIVYTPDLGLAWAVMPITITLSFLIGGVFLAKPMRDKKYLTMMDPFCDKYGRVISGVFSVALIMNDIVWVPSTLMGLGASMSVILDLSYAHCIWISATISIIYTLLGGLFSVAYTDIVQLTLMFFGLWLCIPFLLMNTYSVDITTTALNFTYQAPWVTSVESDRMWQWIDQMFLLIFGNLACQDYYQRILSASSSATARMISFIAAPVILIFSIPPILIGAIAASTDWNKTGYGSPSPVERGEASLIMPITLQQLTPNYISIIGISATAAAVMSTIDSLLLSAVSLFVSSIYKSILRTKASDREVQWVIKGAVLFTGLVGSSLAFLEVSILSYWLLGSTVTYVLMFPQLICILFFENSNAYGAISGLFIGGMLRLLSGEPSLGLPVTLPFPGCTLENGVYVQHAPVSTICMLCNLISTLVVSYLASLLFNKGLIPERFDICKVKTHQSPQNLTLTSSNTVESDNDLRPRVQNENELPVDESCKMNV